MQRLANIICLLASLDDPADPVVTTGTGRLKIVYRVPGPAGASAVQTINKFADLNISVLSNDPASPDYQKIADCSYNDPNTVSLADLPIQRNCVSVKRVKIGTDYQINCPANMAMVDFRATSSDNQDGQGPYISARYMRGTCCNVGNMDFEGSPQTVSAGKSVGANNTEHYLSCPAGHIISRLRFDTYDPILDGGMLADCSRVTGQATVRRSWGTAGSQYGVTKDTWGTHEFRCQSGFVSAIGFYAARQFDNITRVSCDDFL